ncbi:MAG: hypothetical protein O3B75_09040 [Planctomycetota bacterium]|nr:hypothetical protein [Planctomycetota bacterium]
MRIKNLSYVAGTLIATCTSVGAYAQGGLDCSGAVSVFDGDNAYDQTPGTLDMDYTGLCDMGQFGTDTNFNTVWFMWTATTTDTYTFSTCNTAGGVDSRLSAQTDCTAASVVACNDDGVGCANFSSIMTLSANAGTLYYIAVGVYSETTVGGPGTMSITVGGGGGGGGNCPDGEIEDCNGNCCPAEWVGDGYCDDGTYLWNGVPIYLNCDQFGNDGGDCDGGGGGGCGTGGDCCVSNPGTTGCLEADCCTTVCAADPWCCETEWDQICADQAVVICTSCGAGSCDVPACSTAEQEACGEDLNGGCNGGGANEPLSSLNTCIAGTFYSSTATRDTDWYGFTVTAGTEITLNLFSNLPSFCAIVDNPGCTIVGEISTGSCPSTLTACIGPGDYYIVALPSQFIDLPCGGPLGNEYTLEISSVSCSFVPPAGDNCSDAIVAEVGSNYFTNINAGTSFGEVTCGFGGAPFTKDVFFSFVAPATDGYTFATCGSSAEFDTGIEIWDGCPDAGGNQLACNDDCPESAVYASRAFADLTAGITYIIRIGGWNGATGTTELLISQGAPVGPPNDNCADASVAIVGSNPFDTNGSSTDGPNPTDPSCGAFDASFFNDVWFNFTATTTENYLVSLCSATWDTRLDIYDACGGALVVCNDDADSGACNLASEVTLAATAGTTYSIRIGGYGAADFGVGDMVISTDGGGGGGGGEGLSCAEAVVLPMGDTAFTRVGATVDLDYAGLCDMGQFGTDFNYNCIFYKFTPTEAGVYTFSTCNTVDHDTRLSAQTSCETSSVVACNDDGEGCATFSSIMTADLSCGTEYIIALGGYSATTPLGTGTLNVSIASPVSCGTPCPGDFNNDGLRNGADLAFMLSAWGTVDGDVNGDGLTNGADLAALLSGWGDCPQ